MRLEPIRESFTLSVAVPVDALQAVGAYAAERGRVLEQTPGRIVFRMGSAFTFRMLGTFYEQGRRSIPVKVTAALPAVEAAPHLALVMESQERGYVFRAPWMGPAYDERFREIYAGLEGATHRPPGARRGLC